MRGAGVGGLVAHGLQPLLVGLVHALGDGDEEVGIGCAPALGLRARKLDRAMQRRPGGEAAGDIDGGVAVLERQRLDDARFVGGKIVVGDGRAAGLQVGGDVARQAAFVVFARAAVGQPLIGLAEIAELEVADVGLPVDHRHAAVVAQIGGARGRELGEVARALGEHDLHVPVELHAALGERGARRHHVLPFQAAEALQRLGEAGDHAGHGDRVIADLVPLLEDVGPGEGIGGAGADDLVGRRDRASWPRSARSRSSRRAAPWRSRSS